MEAKRAARAAASGFDLTAVNSQLEAFVEQQLDVLVRGRGQAEGGRAGVRALCVLWSSSWMWVRERRGCVRTCAVCVVEQQLDVLVREREQAEGARARACV